MAIFPFYYCCTFFGHLNLFIYFVLFSYVTNFLLLVALQVLAIYNHSPFFNFIVNFYICLMVCFCLFSMLQLMMVEFIVNKPFMQTSR
jgi:hypothetical protein